MAHNLKVGIIGCGPAGSQVMYAPVWCHLRDVELGLLWDPDPDNAHKLQQMSGDGKVAPNIEELWEADIEAVIIASPVWAHAEQTISALDHGLHVLCEKPMARSVQECQAMIDAATNSGKALMVGFMKRYDKSFLKATEMVESGELGDLIEVRCNWSFGVPRQDRIGMSREMPQTWGVPVEEIQRGIKHGVRKINIDTDNRMAITGAIRKVLAEKPGEFDPRAYLKPAKEAMRKLCIERYQQFGCEGQASKIKPLSTAQMAKRYASGELNPQIGASARAA